MNTIDLTDEQLNYLRKVVLADVCQNQRFIRLADYDTATVHNDIQIGSQLIAILPQPNVRLLHKQAG